MKKAAFILSALLILNCTLVFADAKIPNPTSDFYVNDFADVLSKSTENEIMTIGVDTYKSYGGLQAVVVTVESTDGVDYNTYAADLFNKYGIGTDDMGVLLFVATKDRDVKIEVGLALEEILTDAKCGRILDNYVVPYLRENDWDGGILNGYREIVRAATSDAPYEPQGEQEEEGIPDFVRGIIGIILLILFANIFPRFPFFFFRGGGGFGGGRGGFGGGGFGGGGFGGGGGRSGGGGAGRSF